VCVCVSLGPLVLRRCGLERLLRGGRAAAARAFPAWEWMGDVRGGVKRADPKGGALNHAWVPTENTRGNVSVSEKEHTHTHTPSSA
jgi:hypothetical protein